MLLAPNHHTCMVAVACSLLIRVTNNGVNRGGRLTGHRPHGTKTLCHLDVTSTRAQQSHISCKGTPWFGAACGQHGSWLLQLSAPMFVERELLDQSHPPRFQLHSAKWLPLATMQIMHCGKRILAILLAKRLMVHDSSTFQLIQEAAAAEVSGVCSVLRTYTACNSKLTCLESASAALYMLECSVQISFLQLPHMRM